MSLKVMVVDDTIFYRKIIKDVLETIPDVEVVGTVNSGALALNRYPSLKPDVITLDVEMPGLNGLQVLEKIKEKGWDVACIMVSSKTHEGSEATIKALELGGFDFVPKHDDTSAQANIAYLSKELTRLLGAVTRQRELRERFSKPLAPAPLPEEPMVVPAPAGKPVERTGNSVVVGIGVSTGGPNALLQVLPRLPGDIGIPILLVQHMPPIFSASLAQSLNKKCALTVKEAEDGERVQPNVVYIAAGGKQMKVRSTENKARIIQITDDPPENNCKPSVDYLFRSIAKEYGARSTCVIMTGMGADGKLGSALAKASGGLTIAQNAETCVVYGMPKAVIEAGLADVVAPLERISDEILKTL